MFRPNVSSMVDWVYKPVVCVFKFWDAEKKNEKTHKKNKTKTGTSEQPF